MVKSVELLQKLLLPHQICCLLKTLLQQRFFHQIEIDILCKSKSAVSNVSIDTESEGFYQIFSQDDSIHIGKYDHNIKIDNIRPENDVKVILWSSNYYRSDKFKINYDAPLKEHPTFKGWDKRKAKKEIKKLNKMGIHFFIHTEKVER